MVFVHNSRVVSNVVRGLWKRRRALALVQRIQGGGKAATTTSSTAAADNNNTSETGSESAAGGSSSLATTTTTINTLGVGPHNQHIYTGRVGFFDIDYLGHMNNASYLSHCEYARWEMCAMNGLLHAMYKNNVTYVLGSAHVRFRKEIRPLYQPFVIETYACGITDRSLYMVQNFRYPSTSNKNNTTTTNGTNGDNTTQEYNFNPNRILAQVIIEGLTIQGRQVIDPGLFLIDHCGIDPKLIDSLRTTTTTTTTNAGTTTTTTTNPTVEDDESNTTSSTPRPHVTDMLEKVQRYMDLDQSMKDFASNDDDQRKR